MQTDIISSGPQVISVSALNQTVARLLEKNIPLCWISGEVSNFTRAASGHWYFTLKDAQAQVRAVMFKSRAMSVDFIPREGEKIEVRATVTLYAPRGDYQLSVEGIRRAGMGNLYEAFLQLKQKLSNAGLFNPERKRSLPTFPKSIGIVTSPQAAALRDILITLRRRAPHVRVIIYPTPVQGNGAAEKITQAINTASTRNECDVLLVARGGGSIEDLWSFNDEQVAYALVNCRIPVIAGIGHETDFTIADFVADLRAPTPTAAAELAVVARADLVQQLSDYGYALRRAVRRKVEQDAQSLDHFSRRLVSPLAYIQRERLKLLGLQRRVKHASERSQQSAFFAFSQLKQRLTHQKPDVVPHKRQLEHLSKLLKSSVGQQYAHKQQQLTSLNVQLELLNPQRTLERGYAIIWDKSGAILRKPSQLKAPSSIRVKLAEGEVDLGIASVQSNLG